MRKLIAGLLVSTGVLISYLGFVPIAHAGNDVFVACANEGPCTVTSSGPLFSESNFAPGETRSQQITISNNGNDSCQVEGKAEGSLLGAGNINDQVFIAVLADGSPIYGGITDTEANTQKRYSDFIGGETFPLGIVNQNSSRTFTWLATFNREAGNEYQGRSSSFDIILHFECGTESNTNNPTSSNNEDDDENFSSTSENLNSSNSIVLSALGLENQDVVNTTTNLLNQVLGTADQQETTEVASENPSGQVAGAISDVCSNWKQYLPWILLIVQALLIVLLELVFKYRLRTNITLWALAVAATMISIAVFYLLRECDCFVADSWQYRLCQWYWMVAIAVGVITKLIAHKLIHVKE